VNWKRFVRVVSLPFLLAGLVTGCRSPITPSSTGPLVAPSPTGPVVAPSPTGPVDTAEAVGGVVSERTQDGTQAISGAIVELFLGDSPESGNILIPLKETLTGANGGYLMHLPSPLDGSGGTGPDGQAFEVRVSKDGYRSASQSFRHAYSVWSYGGVEVNLELVRD